VRTVHVVVPDSVDDPTRPSGGNTYDRRVCTGLRGLGWAVDVHRVPGRWPHPDAGGRAALARTLAALPPDAVVVVDGLVACGHPDLLVPASRSLRLVVLVHLPLGHPVAAGGRVGPAAGAERRVLEAATAVLTTSRWTANWLLAAYGLRPERLHVARPGVDRAQPATGTASGTALLDVAAVVPAKGHLELVDALASLKDRSWRLVCAGALDVDPDHVARVRDRCREVGIAGRVSFPGPLVGGPLDRAYAAADLVVVPSRIETYGLVVTEALARAVPVVARAVGGLEEAMGEVPGWGRPGLLVPSAPDDRAAPASSALAEALRAWLDDRLLRDRLRAVARARRTALSPWSETALRVSDVLAAVVDRPSTGLSGARAGSSLDSARVDGVRR